MTPMSATHRHRLILLVAALLVAMTGVVSAARMGPQTPPALAAYLAAGGDLSDICGGLDAEHDHDCPFCRLLSDPPEIVFSPRIAQCMPVMATSSSAHLVRGREIGNTNILARAPPAQA